MTKLTGRSTLWVDGVDLGGDFGGLSRAGGGPTMLDVSGLDQGGFERLAGRFDGSIEGGVWFNPSRAHPVFRNHPTGNRNLMVPIPPEDGAYTAMLVGKQMSYDMAVQNSLGAGFTFRAMAAAGFAVEWGFLITDGKRTDTAATATGTGIDLGIPKGVPAVTITSASAASPTSVLTATPHLLQTGDSVLISGTDKSALNDAFTVTVVDPTHFTVAVDLTGGAATGGTMQRTSHRGWAAQSQVFSVVGTSVTVKIQHAPKNLAGSMGDLSGGGFAAVLGGANGAERIKSASGIVQRFVRVATTGTFNPATFAAAIAPGRD